MSRPPSLLNRRRFLSLSAATAAAVALPAQAQPKPDPNKPGNLRFVFFTDTHLQPELKATEGTAKALARIRTIKPAFCIQGGDHTFDIAAVPARSLAPAARPLPEDRAGARRHAHPSRPRQPRRLRPRPRLQHRDERSALWQEGLRAAL